MKRTPGRQTKSVSLMPAAIVERSGAAQAEL